MKENKTTKNKSGKTAKNATVVVKMPTLLEAIERVVGLSEGSKMSDEFLLAASPEIGLIADSYGISEQQAVLFCICMERGPRRVEFDDFARHLGIGKIRALSFASDVDALVRRRLIRYRDAKDEGSFDVYQCVIKSLKHNEVYEMPLRKGLDCSELFDYINMLYDDLDTDAIRPVELLEELNELFEENPQIGFVRRIKELHLDGDDFLLLVFMCHLLINKDDEDVRLTQIMDVYDDRSDFYRARAQLRSGKHDLMTENFMEHRSNDGMADVNSYCLTGHAKRTLLAEMNLVTEEEKIADMLRHDDLIEKAMFYSENIKRHVDELTSFLTPEKYKQIRERMQQRGFRHGFACLFYGGPGTGKTETVYQLARQTGRDIMVVDVPQIKSKWVGDSEKNIKALFDRYREQVRRCELAPILLFNEADAIISTRKNGATNAVDKMENTIQNIILQEMETLDGILIATTNLADNLDSAFERRFLYKIQFSKPDAMVRSLIWQQMIPELNAADATTLATAYDFSGGQIENVARKHAIHSVLHGETDSLLHTLQNYCANEKLDSKPVVRRIGF
ncbi:MAG: AAA family ATPase [Bacteroidaceae bacterium]|nr:AAA family ATPase [Bacteroidaceae bacterium]